MNQIFFSLILIRLTWVITPSKTFFNFVDLCFQKQSRSQAFNSRSIGSCLYQTIVLLIVRNVFSLCSVVLWILFLLYTTYNNEGPHSFSFQYYVSWTLNWTEWILNLDSFGNNMKRFLCNMQYTASALNISWNNKPFYNWYYHKHSLHYSSRI